MSSWQPIASDELRAQIDLSLSEAPEELHRLHQLVQIEPEKWALSPWGDEGGGFWVVAVFGRFVIWYNDIEEGFNVSPFKRWGVIEEYACEQLKLHHWLSRLNEHVSTGQFFSASRLGPPEAAI